MEVYGGGTEWPLIKLKRWKGQSLRRGAADLAGDAVAVAAGIEGVQHGAHGRGPGAAGAEAAFVAAARAVHALRAVLHRMPLAPLRGQTAPLC